MTTVVKVHGTGDHSRKMVAPTSRPLYPCCVSPPSFLQPFLPTSHPPSPHPYPHPTFLTPLPFFHKALSLGNFFSHDSYFQAMLVVGFECIIQCRTDCLSAFETLLFNQVNGREQNLFFFSLFFFFFFFFSLFLFLPPRGHGEFN